LQERKLFLIAFVVAGFVMKLIAEVVHEIFGHGLFILLFGGAIKTVYISILWPYDFSYISWYLPSMVSSAQMAWIYGGGILTCLCSSLLTQAFLIAKKKMAWHSALTLFWLAFWTLINSTGYLIIGGLAPFGDIYELIELGVLTSLLSLVAGLIIFFMGFVVLYWILRKILIAVFPPKKASLGVIFFWFIIPVLVIVMLANPERGMQVAYLTLTFIPAMLSFIIEYFMVLSKQEADANPDNIAEE